MCDGPYGEDDHPTIYCPDVTDGGFDCPEEDADQDDDALTSGEALTKWEKLGEVVFETGENCQYDASLATVNFNGTTYNVTKDPTHAAVTDGNGRTWTVQYLGTTGHGGAWRVNDSRVWLHFDDNGEKRLRKCLPA